MYNDLFSIGPVTVHGYGLMIAIGITCALILASKRAPGKGLDADIIYGMGIAALIFGFLGAKVLYVIVEFKTFLKDPMMIFSGSGFVVYGGIIAGVAAAIIYSRRKGARFLPYFDLAVPSVALA